VPCYRSLDTGPRFVVGVLLSAARFSSAQLPPPRVVSSLDVSATNVWYADTIRSNGVSIMPAGFDQQLTPQELADLVAFLKACR